MAICTVNGPWDAVLNSPGVSQNEFQTDALAILTQIVNSLAGSSIPIPTDIPSDNQFRAGALAALCVIAGAMSGGGGAIGGNPFKVMALAGNEPPSDGTVDRYLVYDSDEEYRWLNIATIAAPLWRPI